MAHLHNFRILLIHSSVPQCLCIKVKSKGISDRCRFRLVHPPPSVRLFPSYRKSVAIRSTPRGDGNYDFLVLHFKLKDTDSWLSSWNLPSFSMKGNSSKNNKTRGHKNGFGSWGKTTSLLYRRWMAAHFLLLFGKRTYGHARFGL